METSIIVVSWNTRELLEACLASVFAYPPSGEFEVWVVENASKDGSDRMVRERFPGVKLIESKTNLGFGAANNLAIRQSEGRYFLLLNPDTEVRPNALETLVNFMDKHPEAGASGPCLLNPNNSLQPSCSPVPTLRSELLRMFHLPGIRPDGYYAMGGWDRTRAKEVDVMLGACMLLRQEAVDKAGAFDEDFFMYSEEVDLCSRIRKAGWQLFWVPQAEVVHHGGQSTRQAASEMFITLYRSKLQYFRKHHNWTAAPVYKTILFFACLARLAASPLVLFEKKTEREQHLKLVGNYRRLLFSLPGL